MTSEQLQRLKQIGEELLQLEVEIANMPFKRAVKLTDEIMGARFLLDEIVEGLEKQQFLGKKNSRTTR